MNESNIVVTKRSGENVPFDKEKIGAAVKRANLEEGIPANRLTDKEILEIEEAIALNAKNAGRPLHVEEIQDNVENMMMDFGKHNVARRYIIFRAEQNKKRNNNNGCSEMNNFEKRIMNLIESKNDEDKEENANKNPEINSTQRDYMAGEISKEISSKYLLPADIVEAHEEGIIHFHDMDYFSQKMNNCCLINLEDMLQNGTSISGTKIDPPKSFSTACTVTSQIVAQVASMQYGLKTSAV